MNMFIPALRDSVSSTSIITLSCYIVTYKCFIPEYMFTIILLIGLSQVYHVLCDLLQILCMVYTVALMELTAFKVSHYSKSSCRKQHVIELSFFH